MVKVRVKGLNKFKKLAIARVRRIARQAITDQKTANSIKNRAVLLIRKDFILPDDTAGPETSTAWINRRKRLATVNKTNSKFNAEQSKLNFTGKWLGSFKVTIKKSKKVVYVMFPTGNHKGYTMINGSVGSSVSNEALGGYLLDKGYNWTKLGPLTADKLNKLIVRRIDRALKLAKI